MRIVKLVQQNEALCHLPGGSKKRLFQTLANIMAERNTDLSADAIFDGLTRRDRLGTTGIGNGIAIPHCRLPGCPQLTAQLATLDASIEYDAVDGQPVDIIFVLLAPEEHHDAHLEALSQIARLLNDLSTRRKLRKAQDNATLHATALELATDLESRQMSAHS
ncbi:MAG: PTS sugar transporter subunit IIA [Gammaproteobacteria bacterium]